MSKGPDAFRTISEVAEELDLPQHVLRFWETRFTQIRPMKRGGGRRYYRPDDVDLLRGIRRLLYGEGYTIKGVQRILKEQGLRHVTAAGHDGPLDPAPEAAFADEAFIEEFPEDESADFSRPAMPDLPGQRREPMFEARQPIGSPVGGQRSPSRSIPSVSNFPAAPPDEPDDLEVYLPPLVEKGPAPPERIRPAEPADDPFRPPTIEERRESAASQPEGFAPHAEAPRMTRPVPPQPTVPNPAPAVHSGGGPLSREHVGLLHAALAELLECKRILDQAR